jgi:hypothetical protein
MSGWTLERRRRQSELIRNWAAVGAVHGLKDNPG